ncbi:T9SS type A sorting domain-containing protein [Adhaeribacter terreus]|uniref:T9SS type A sorting domain-containing protein n=1 Tax=Adhaeribacter terreus TaxID=529703 RepID=A0ABW0EBW5_9BACT
MKRLSLLISFILSLTLGLAFNTQAQTLDNNPLGICEAPPPGCQEIPICTFYDDCFRFDFYAPRDLGNGTSVLKHKITNFSESTFKQATFELPGNGASTPAAVSPTTSFRNRYNHSVVNKFNDSLIAFNAINAGTFSYGGFEVYYYIVNNADLNAPSGRSIQVTAKAGRPWQLQRTGTVIIDVDDCVGAPGDTACLVQENDNYRLLFPFFSPNASGNNPLNFTLINKTASDVDFIQMEASSAIVSPLNGTGYTSPVNVPFYSYDVSNASPLRFTRTVAAPSTVGYANGLRDIFNFEVVAAPFQISGSLITVVVRNDAGVQDTFIFECAECGPIVPLPVTLTSFKGKLTPDGIALDWSTGMEKNNDRFEVERSMNGKDFEKIGIVKGNGNSNNHLSYDFLDRSPQQGTNYYRLRQVDFDGKAEFSKIVTVKNGSKVEVMKVSMVPNPCIDGKCTINLQHTDRNLPVTVEIRDLTGRMVFSKEIPNNQTTFELPKLETGAGIYILSAKNGDYTAVQKVILK